MMDFGKQLDEHLQTNKELRELFAKYPERKQLYLDKIIDSYVAQWGCPTLDDRYGDEVLTDNTALNHYAQCQDCMFRDVTAVQGKECGWKKCYCSIFEKPESKPDYVRDNAEECECYEKA